MLAAVRPLPREEITPPVTKMCLVIRPVEPESEDALSEVSATGFHAIRREPGSFSTRGVP